MRKVLIAAALLVLPAVTTPAFADAHMEAEGREMLEQDWHRLYFTRFHAGKQDRAEEIIAMYVKADEAIGREPPTLIYMNSGPWDLIRIRSLKDGIAQLGWRDTADSAAWREALAEIAGGAEEALAIRQEFPTLIAERERHIGHTN